MSAQSATVLNVPAPPPAAPVIDFELAQTIGAMSSDQRGRLFHQLALVLFQQGNIDQAMIAIGDAMGEGQTSMRWNDYATIALARNDLEAAVLGYRRAVEIDANNQRARVNLIILLRGLNCPEEADSFVGGTDATLLAAEEARVTALQQSVR